MLALTVVFCSCSNEDELFNEDLGSHSLEFTATIEGGEVKMSRAIFDNSTQCASWEKDDKIVINGVEYKAKKSGSTSAFVAVTQGKEATTPDYTAYFPASTYFYSEYYHKVMPKLPENINETYGKFNMPMCASSSTTNLKFKNLCGVLKIIVTNTDAPTVRRIKVSSQNCAFSGSFTVEDNAAKLDAPNNAKASVTVNYSENVSTDADGKEFYIALPPVTGCENLRVDIDPDGCGFTKGMVIKNNDITIERSKIYTIAFANTETVFTPTSKLLTGDFSVSDTKKVNFTWSNIYWNGTTYKMEPNPTSGPYMYMENHVGHFFWIAKEDLGYKADNYNYAIYPYTEDSYKVRWATIDVFNANEHWCSEKNKITVDDISDLYILSQPEWDYVLAKRPNATQLRRSNVTVNGMPGCLVLAPDNYPTSGYSAYSGGAWVNTAIASSYTLEELYNDGLVCLAPCGFRNTIPGIPGPNYVRGQLESVGIIGVYQSSSHEAKVETYSPVEEYVYSVEFQSANLNTKRGDDTGNGQSIRLVKTVSE